MEHWFDAAISNDLKTLRRLSKKYAKKYDNESDEGHRIGFCAVHYAIMHSYLDAVLYLMPLEFDMLTKCAVSFDNFILSSGSCITHLAAAVSNYEVLDAVLAYRHNCDKVHIFMPNNDNLITLDIFALSCTRDTVPFITEEFLLTEMDYLAEKEKTNNFLYNACAYGRTSLLSYLLATFEKMPYNVRIKITFFCFKNHGGVELLKALDKCENKVDQKAFASCYTKLKQLRCKGISIIAELYWKRTMKQHAMRTGCFTEEEVKKDLHIVYNRIDKMILDGVE
ncbi:Ankyrin_repeat-containing protein [Hexamita inflata]|uniref:Ankyrin repeat-containing protein n=1 Tax=Hexamita inflata TaxID=28002 RepID=A0AA86USS3_9EUKA|nr:Ankyrin repeat-containing protein [Hexamita inflata]